MTKIEYIKNFKQLNKTLSFIEDLKLDIQYLQNKLDNGFYKSQLDKNYKSSDLESLEGMLKKITEELNK